MEIVFRRTRVRAIAERLLAAFALFVGGAPVQAATVPQPASVAFWYADQPPCRSWRSSMAVGDPATDAPTQNLAHSWPRPFAYLSVRIRRDRRNSKSRLTSGFPRGNVPGTASHDLTRTCVSLDLPAPKPWKPKVMRCSRYPRPFPTPASPSVKLARAPPAREMPASPKLKLFFIAFSKYSRLAVVAAAWQSIDHAGWDASASVSPMSIRPRMA